MSILRAILKRTLPRLKMDAAGGRAAPEPSAEGQPVPRSSRPAGRRCHGSLRLVRAAAAHASAQAAQSTSSEVVVRARGLQLERALRGSADALEYWHEGRWLRVWRLLCQRSDSFVPVLRSVSHFCLSSGCVRVRGGCAKAADSAQHAELTVFCCMATCSALAASASSIDWGRRGGSDAREPWLSVEPPQGWPLTALTAVRATPPKPDVVRLAPG